MESTPLRNGSIFTERLRELVANKGITLEYSDGLGTALGRSSGGAIALADGLEPADEFSTLVHELAHEMLHRSGKRATKTVRETEAEAVAFVVSRAIGLDVATTSAEYSA